MKSTGLSRGEALGKPYWEVQSALVDPAVQSQQQADRVKAIIQEALRTGQAPIFERGIEIAVPLRHAPNRTFQQTIFPIKTDSGYRIGSITRDITEQKQAEAELHRRDTILEAVSVTSKLLLQATDWRQETMSMLETLSLISESDRAGVFQIDHDDQGKVLGSIRYLWEVPNLPPAFHYDLLQNEDVAG